MIIEVYSYKSGVKAEFKSIKSGIRNGRRCKMIRAVIARFQSYLLNILNRTQCINEVELRRNSRTLVFQYSINFSPLAGQHLFDKSLFKYVDRVKPVLCAGKQVVFKTLLHNDKNCY